MARPLDDVRPDDAGPVALRDETPADADAVDGLLRRAFAAPGGRPRDERPVLQALRTLRAPEAGPRTLSIVAVRSDVEPAGTAVVGHVAAWPVRAGDAPGGWHALGPLAVEPCRQRQGIGRRLVVEALARLRARGAAGCVVVGDPAWFAVFGLRAWPRLVLPGAPPDRVLALPFLGFVPSGDIVVGTALADVAAGIHPPEFVR